MPKVIIPSPLRKYTNNQREVTIVGESLKETMESLSQQYPGFETITNDSAILSVFVNSKSVKTEMEKWDELFLNKEDEITLIIPIAGG